MDISGGAHAPVSKGQQELARRREGWGIHGGGDACWKETRHTGTRAWGPWRTCDVGGLEQSTAQAGRAAAKTQLRRASGEPSGRGGTHSASSGPHPTLTPRSPLPCQLSGFMQDPDAALHVVCPLN